MRQFILVLEDVSEDTYEDSLTMEDTATDWEIVHEAHEKVIEVWWGENVELVSIYEVKGDKTVEIPMT